MRCSAILGVLMIMGGLQAEPSAYAPAMKEVAAKFRGRPGVVLHVGDSITYANPYGAWARYGEGKTDADRAVLKWMHTGDDNDQDGWYLARFDHPAGGRSHTACNGIRANELLAGGNKGLPAYDKLLRQYKPQIVVLMIGTNDVSANRSVAAYRADVTTLLKKTMADGVIPILSTIPPHIGNPTLAAKYNVALRDLATELSIPLIDYEREILTRRKTDWNGTLLNKGDVHPTVGIEEVKPNAAPTETNLSRSGYLLRGWLSVQKIAEVKAAVIDSRP